jgi:hypothetical protein
MKKLSAWVYGLQCFLVVPWFLGAFYRHEMSTVPWHEFAKQVDRHGTADALFGLYLYAIFYSLPAVLTWVYLPQCVRREFRVLLAVWVGYTFFLFLPGILEVVGRGWLFGTWLILSVLVVTATAPLIKKIRRGTGNDT